MHGAGDCDIVCPVSAIEIIAGDPETYSLCRK